MPSVNFPLYQYVPVLGSTDVERIAYDNLRPETQSGILPLFELTRHRGGRDFSESIDLLQGITDLPFLLDIDKRSAPLPYQSNNPSNPIADQQRVERETEENDAFNASLNSLLSPVNGFQAWRDLVGQFPQSIPVLQCTNLSAQINAIVRQAAFLGQNGNCIAIRIGPAQSELFCAISTQIISILPNSSQILLIFDCGQGRRGTSDKADWVKSSLHSITSSIEVAQAANISAVCMSNSYPQLNHAGLRTVTNCDRDLWNEACEAFPFMFGDYAANTRLGSLSAFMPRNYRATVVHSQDNAWVTHRHENSDDPNGWRVGCQAIITSGEFDPIESWTDDQIVNVSQNGLGNMNSTRPWHAARIVGHIERQFGYAQEIDDED